MNNKTLIRIILSILVLCDMNSEAIESKQSNGFNIDNEYKLYEEVLQSNFKDYISADAIEIEDNIYEPELFDKMIDCKGPIHFSPTVNIIEEILKGGYTKERYKKLYDNEFLSISDVLQHLLNTAFKTLRQIAVSNSESQEDPLFLKKAKNYRTLLQNTFNNICQYTHQHIIDSHYRNKDYSEYVSHLSNAIKKINRNISKVEIGINHIKRLLQKHPLTEQQKISFGIL